MTALLVVADRIHTLAPGPAPRALLIRDGHVAAVGSPEELRPAEPHAATLDLTGATLTPAFTDAHIHITEWAFARREADLHGATSAAEAAHRLRSATGTGWIRGRGWSSTAWPEAPHRSVLDDVAPDRPVALQSHDMHALWVNTAALRTAGIDAGTPDPADGSIVRDADGEPTGLLLENAAALITRHLPEPSLAEAADAVRDAQQELHTLGFAGIHSFPGIHRPEPEAYDVLHHLHRAGDLTLRALHHVRMERLDEAIAAGWKSGHGDERLRFGAVKMFLDGSLGSRTAWLLEPYEDGSGHGICTLDPDTFRAVVVRAAAAGIASTVHAIGDAAVSLALDVLSRADLQVPGFPHRIEHIQCCPPDRLTEAAAAGVVCSVQPCHLMTDWPAADRFWGARRCTGVFAFGSLLEHGGTLAFGSDAPVEPPDPRRSLHAAVHRTDADRRPAGGWQPQQRIDALAALHGFTTGPARAAGLPASAGTLATGAPADFAAWDRDPLEAGDTLLDMRCLATAVGGVVVHQ